MNEAPFRLNTETFYDYLPDAVIAVDAAGTICVFNERAQRLFGYSADEALGQKIEILVPEPFKESHVAFREHYLKFPSDYCLGAVREVTALRKDGTEFPVDVTLSPQLIDGKQVVFAAVRDATQRLHLESRLVESEERYRLVVNNSRDVIFRTNVKGEWTFLNPAWTELTGFEVQASLGRAFLDFVHPDDLERHGEFFHDIITGVIDECRDEFRYRTASAQFRWVEVHCRGMVDTVSGKIVGSTGGIRDVTKRKYVEMAREQAVQALKESERRFRLLVEQAPDAFYLHDLDGNIFDVNQQACTNLGYSRDELLKLNFTDIEHDVGPVALRADWKAHELEKPRTTEGVNRRKDGTLFPVEIHNRHFKSGGRDMVLALVRDITARKQSAQELERLNKHVRLLLESAGEGILGVNETGHCTFINAAALETLGYTYTEFYGVSIHEAIHHTRTDGSPYPIEECPVYQSYRDGKRRHVNNEVLWRKDGTSFPADYSSYPIVEDGKTSGAVVVFRNVAEARAMSRKMDYLATHDSLTGLINRREFEVRLNNALQNAYEDRSEHVLCYLDLDQFKVVNDTCGHVAGDELLRQLSTLLHSKVRQGDSFGRLGGDEFGLLLDHCSLDRALLIIDELKRTVEEFRFIWGDLTFIVGASIGVVAINRDTDNVATALSSADTACYMAKDKGRNRIHIYQADDVEVAQRHGEMQWVARIHDAFEQQQFYLAYQKIIPVELSNGRQSHIELLIRMHDEFGHAVPPGSFIPAAERYNLMPTVDRWVIRTAFEWLKKNRKLLKEIDLCSINVSGHSLGDELFLEFVTSQFQQQGVPPEKICFEITETTAVANLTDAIHFMELLKRSGCRFALDDFGSGMSSFAYLKNLPVDFLKIDGNFIRDIVLDPVDRAMVEAINQVGHVMGLQTIAEFVENAAIMEQLRHIGVDYAQGFGIAKPRPLQDFSLN